MKNLVAIVLAVILSSGAMAETMELRFSKNSEALFEVGEIQDELYVETLTYSWLGGSVVITAPYKKSIINEGLSCYKLQELGVQDHMKITIHSLERPASDFCITEVDTERR